MVAAALVVRNPELADLEPGLGLELVELEELVVLGLWTVLAELA